MRSFKQEFSEFQTFSSTIPAVIMVSIPLVENSFSAYEKRFI